MVRRPWDDGGDGNIMGRGTGELGRDELVPLVTYVMLVSYQ